MSMGRSRGGSSVWTGCQVAVWALLIPWLLTAAMISLLPRFSYGLVERWVCPADSSIRVEGTAGWFFAVMADDDSVDVPQFECVNSRGAVVLRGDSGSNWLAYLRVVGVVLLAVLPLEVVAFTVIETTSRKRRAAGQSGPAAQESGVQNLEAELASLAARRDELLRGRPHPTALRVHSVLRIVAPLSVFVFGCLFAALAIAEGIHPFFLGGLVLALALQMTDLLLQRQIGPALAAWNAEHREQLGAIESRMAAINAQRRRSSFS